MGKTCFKPAPMLAPYQCVKGVARIDITACDSCCVRSGEPPTGFTFSPKSKGGRVPFITLCPGTVICNVSIAVSECFSDAVTFNVGTYDAYTHEVNEAACLEEGDAGYVDPFKSGSIIPAGTADLTVQTPPPITVPNAEGFMVGRDPLALFLEIEKLELSDYEKGCAAICVEVCIPR